MFESKSGVLFIGGLGFFVFAFVSNALVPIFMYKDLPEQTVLEVVTPGVEVSFEDLQRRYPIQFSQAYGHTGNRLLEFLDENADGKLSGEELAAVSDYDREPSEVMSDLDQNSDGKLTTREFMQGQFGVSGFIMFDQFDEAEKDELLDEAELTKLLDAIEVKQDAKALLADYDEDDNGELNTAELDVITAEKCADALRLGRQVYTGEGCWHCHSQFVRPVSNESRRWGEVAETWEFQNELQRPVMFGTRRVGPDLSREGGRRSNDWHAVHFYDPTVVSTGSPMPAYPWLFDGSPDRPNRRGIALMTYVQWLGSWLDSYPYYEQLEELSEEEF